MVSLQPISATSTYALLPSRVDSILRSATTGTLLVQCARTATGQRSFAVHMEPSATSTTVSGPVGERLQAGSAYTPVLDRPAPLRLVLDSGAGYKYPDLHTYSFTVFFLN